MEDARPAASLRPTTGETGGRPVRNGKAAGLDKLEQWLVNASLSEECPAGWFDWIQDAGLNVIPDLREENARFREKIKELLDLEHGELESGIEYVTRYRILDVLKDVIDLC